MRRKRRRKRGKKNHWQSPLKILRETETMQVIKSDLSWFFSSTVHVVTLVHRMPPTDAWSWGFRPGFPGPNACPRPAALGSLRRSAAPAFTMAARLRRGCGNCSLKREQQLCWPRNNSSKAALQPTACALACRLTLLHCVIEERRFPLLLNQTSSLSTGCDKTRQKDPCWGATRNGQ